MRRLILLGALTALVVWAFSATAGARTETQFNLIQTVKSGHKINNNTFIRTRLLHGWGERSARRWLRRFATCPVEPTWRARLAGLAKDLGGVPQ